MFGKIKVHVVKPAHRNRLLIVFLYLPVDEINIPDNNGYTFFRSHTVLSPLFLGIFLIPDSSADPSEHLHSGPAKCFPLFIEHEPGVVAVCLRDFIIHFLYYAFQIIGNAGGCKVFVVNCYPKTCGQRLAFRHALPFFAIAAAAFLDCNAAFAAVLFLRVKIYAIVRITGKCLFDNHNLSS